MDKIISTLSLDDLLIQLAEEASELAQAATKYYRAAHQSHPTPVSVQDARNALIEEVADVDVAVDALRRKMGITCDEIAYAEAEALERMERDAAGTTDRA